MLQAIQCICPRIESTVCLWSYEIRGKSINAIKRAEVKKERLLRYAGHAAYLNRMRNIQHTNAQVNMSDSI